VTKNYPGEPPDDPVLIPCDLGCVLTKEHHSLTAISEVSHDRPVMPNSVEEVGFRVLAIAMGRRRDGVMSGVTSSRRDRCRYRNQLGELAKVLGSGGARLGQLHRLPILCLGRCFAEILSLVARLQVPPAPT
jgi:hypothetical protein